MRVSVIVIFKEVNSNVSLCLSSVDSCIIYSGVDAEVLTSDKPNKSKARNDLCGKARGEIFAFIDSDATATDNWLTELVTPFLYNSNVGVVGGPNLLRRGADENEVLADKILSFPLATFKSSSRYRVTGVLRDVDESELTSCNIAIKREAFFKAGGFPEEFIPCEENVLLNNIEKLGYRMMYNPLAIVHHNRDRLFLPYCRKIYSYGYGRGRMARRKLGGPRFMFRPSVTLIKLGVGLILHYGSYTAGLVMGYLS